MLRDKKDIYLNWLILAGLDRHWDSYRTITENTRLGSDSVDEGCQPWIVSPEYSHQWSEGMGYPDYRKVVESLPVNHWYRKLSITPIYRHNEENFKMYKKEALRIYQKVLLELRQRRQNARLAKRKEYLNQSLTPIQKKEREIEKAFGYNRPEILAGRYKWVPNNLIKEARYSFRYDGEDYYRTTDIEMRQRGSNDRELMLVISIQIGVLHHNGRSYITSSLNDADVRVHLTNYLRLSVVTGHKNLEIKQLDKKHLTRVAYRVIGTGGLEFLEGAELASIDQLLANFQVYSFCYDEAGLKAAHR